MIYTKEKMGKKYFIGIAVHTSNERFQIEGVPLWERFYDEHCADKIPNRVDQALMAIYTDYEGDYTQPYTFMIGCEVSSLEEIPEDMVGIEIPSANYAVFVTQGPFPQCVIDTWQTIWNSDLNRTYAFDFEIYGADFHPQTNQVKIAIGIE
jgi:predicted transcriptional regulator YdeE